MDRTEQTTTTYEWKVWGRAGKWFMGGEAGPSCWKKGEGWFPIPPVGIRGQASGGCLQR